MRIKKTPSRCWRVFYIRPRAEIKVRDRLDGAGVEAFLPMRTALRQWSDRKKKISIPLFPGYLFAHVNERERLDVLQDDGVVRSVSFGGELAVARDEEIDALRLLADYPEELEAVALRAFPRGSKVLVTGGPLSGVQGLVIDHPKSQYLLVEVPSIRQAVKIHLPMDWAMRVAA